MFAVAEFCVASVPNVVAVGAVAVVDCTIYSHLVSLELLAVQTNVTEFGAMFVVLIPEISKQVGIC